jgi:C-terminal processing protease CtpA/Prc
MSLPESLPDDADVTAKACDVEMPVAARVVRLKREALLPIERRNGMSQVTIACMLTGLASGLALATTLMAMQAVSVQQRCPSSSAGLLGVSQHMTANGAAVEDILQNSPAHRVGLRSGDIITAVDSLSLAGTDDRYALKTLIQSISPGTEVTLTVQRGTQRLILRPTLAAWPVR